MYFEELVKRSYIKSEPPNEEEVVLLASGCRPQVDRNLVVSKSDFESVLMGYRASDPTSEAVLMSIGRSGITLGDPIWDVILQRESVVDRFAQLCNDEAARTLSSLERSETEGVPDLAWGSGATEPAGAEPQPAVQSGSGYEGWPPAGAAGSGDLGSGAAAVQEQPYGEEPQSGYSAFPEQEAAGSGDDQMGSEYGSPPGFTGFGQGVDPTLTPPGSGADPSGFGDNPEPASAGYGAEALGFAAGFEQGSEVYGGFPAPAIPDAPAFYSGEGLFGIPAGPENMGLYVDDPNKHMLYDAEVFEGEAVEDAPAPGAVVETEEGGAQQFQFGGAYDQQGAAPQFGGGEGQFSGEGFESQFGAVQQEPEGASLPGESQFFGEYGTGALPGDQLGGDLGNPFGAGFGSPLSGFQQEGFQPEGFQQEAAEPGFGGFPPETEAPSFGSQQDGATSGVEEQPSGFQPEGDAAAFGGFQSEGDVASSSDQPFGFEAMTGGPLESLGAEEIAGQAAVQPGAASTLPGPEPQRLYDVPGYTAPPPMEEASEVRYTAPESLAGDRRRPGFYSGVGAPEDILGSDINSGGLGNLGQLPSEEGGDGIPPRGTTAEFQAPVPMEDVMVDQVNNQGSFGEGPEYGAPAEPMPGFGDLGAPAEPMSGFGTGFFGGEAGGELTPEFGEGESGVCAGAQATADSDATAAKLQRISESFNLFHSLVKQYTLKTILASENLTAVEFCNNVVAEFPMFTEQLNESLRTYDQDFDRAACSLVQSLQLEAESAVYSGDDDRAEKCIAPVCKLIYS